MIATDARIKNRVIVIKFKKRSYLKSEITSCIKINYI